MKFQISFCPKKGVAISIYPKEGINAVDATREMFELPDFPVEDIDSIKGYYEKRTTVDVPEEIARNSGHFQEDALIKVTVKEELLNRYAVVEKDPFCTRDAKGSYKSIRLRHVVDKTELLEDWSRAGYPLYWEVEEE